MNFVFFGSSPISVTSLDELETAGFLPLAVVTQPDRPKGRHLELSPSPVKVWAEKRNIKVLTPEKIRTEEFVDTLKAFNAEVFILVSYGKIIPESILSIPPKGIVNLHPSLLPKLRGPSPIESTILNDMKNEVGVTVMLLDVEMDTGPILAQKNVPVATWVPSRTELYDLLSIEGAKLLRETVPKWLKGEIAPVSQNKNEATYCYPIEKKDGEITLSEDAYKNFLKFKAYEGWPGTYFFFSHHGKQIRVKITDASFEDHMFVIKKVIPEGKKEMSYEDFLKGHRN